MPNATKHTSLRPSSPPINSNPPPYQSGNPSPDPNVHEIDSSQAHCLQKPADVVGSENRNAPPASSPRIALGEAEDGIAELPHSPAGGSRWRSKEPTAMASVEICQGNPPNSETRPVSDIRSSSYDIRRKTRESYVSWQTLSP